MDHQTLLALFDTQVRSANVWIDQYNKYRDGPSVRNASLAIGKVAGIYNVIQAATQANSEPMPVQVSDEMTRMSNIYDNMVVRV